MLAVVTGASSGIGTAFARKLARKGYDVLLVARREDRLQSLARELQESCHVKASAFPADLASAAGREKLAQALETAPDLSLLVNNAGFGTNGYFFETDVTRQVEMHELHVVATVRLCHAAIQNWTRGAGDSGRCGIINVSSIAAFSSAPLNASYCSTKRWMNGFTEALAMELRGTAKPITVQALCPGYTLSEFHDKLHMDRNRIPRSMWMTPDFVVDESLAAFQKGTLFVIPGWRYKALVGAMRVLPAPVLRAATIRAVQRYREKKDVAHA
jgi:short-subunit dehydrogenase